MTERMPSRGSRRPLVIGVTGNIACGKSTVMQTLADLGAETIDGDVVYHALIEPGKPLWRMLRDRFGNGIVGPDGTIDRRALGAIVFADPTALADLDRLTHPAVIAAIKEQIASSDAEVIAVDGVKLIESGMDALCDQVWVVTCTPDQQVARLKERSGLSAAEAAKRVAAQPPIGPKLARADRVIDNSGSIAATRRQVDDAWRELSKLK